MTSDLATTEFLKTLCIGGNQLTKEIDVLLYLLTKRLFDLNGG
jgi:hypothetical protein